jgi:SAM-dependent MidA family methyltransferase
MDMALYYPDLGYYSSEGTPIGRKGDFYTGSHLHPIFGAMVARQLMEMWDVMGRPQEFHAIEMGAGAGYLCKDILDYLSATSNVSEDFMKAMRLVIVEPYQHFEDVQRELLENDEKNSSQLSFSKGGQTITWVESLPALGRDITGCVFSNELPDAFPVHIVEMEKELMEVFVSFDGEKFVEERGELSTEELSGYIREFSAGLSSGYRTEINLRIRGWLQEISSVLKDGFLMTIDYGYSAREYYDDERSKGTLLCYYKHNYNDNPYQHIGKQDITAHVNFSSLRKWGGETGLKTLGYCPQGTYLTASGIDEVIMELYKDSPDYLSEISRVKGLIFPQGMGVSHQVMIQYKGQGMPDLRGFSMRNLVKNLYEMSDE